MSLSKRKTLILLLIYVIATIQFVWCYLWLTRPYVSTILYEQGRERMPFQGRALMMLPMVWAHHCRILTLLSAPFGRSHFWFPRPVAPEVIVQAVIDVLCLILTGYLTTKIYEASSKRQLLTAMVYPLFLVVCGATYVLHTVQNFRFIYDLPSLAFFSIAMYVMYFRKPWPYFAGLFVLATANRETTLLLLQLYMLNEAVVEGRLFYPRINWNVKSILVPQAWPQLLSACGYLLVFVLMSRRRICDARLRVWLWIVPVWCVFMFVYGILIETRVFGELIPLVVCATVLIVEEMLVARMTKPERVATLEIAAPASGSLAA